MRSRPLCAYQLPSGPELSRAFAKALDGTGPAVLPLPVDLPATRLRGVLAELRPGRLVTLEGTRVLSDGVGVAAGVAMVIATSGSTGRPKGVELTGAALTHSAGATLSWLGARPGDRWLACLPPDHVAGAQVLVRSFVSGTEPVYARPDIDALSDVIARGEVQYVSLVPTLLQRLLDAGADLRPLRAILLGGTLISSALLRRATAAGTTVASTYGMTETSGGCVYDGLPLPGVRADVASDGRVRLAGPTLFDRYRLRPAETAAAFDGQWLVTADLGQWKGGRLRPLGRADDVIVSGGVNVAPAEVAEILADHSGVDDVAVIGRPDDEWGERVVAVVVPCDPNDPPSAEALREHVRAHAPVHMLPRDVDIVDSIPLLPSGKPDRGALRRGSRRGALP